VHVDPLGLAGGLPLPTAVGEVADQFLFLGVDRFRGVDRDDRLPGGEVDLACSLR